jgi:hypothetical protein
MDEILEELVPIMKKEFPRRAPTNENLYNYYTARVRRNLHVVLCFSPVRKTNQTIECKEQCKAVLKKQLEYDNERSKFHKRTLSSY